MPSRLATSLTVKLCGGNSFFNTASFLSGEYRVTHSSLALCSINDDLMRVTTSLTQGGLLRYLQKAGIEVLEVTAPDRTALRKRGKDNTKDAENDAHAAFANIRTVTPKSRDRMVESLSVLISCRKAQSMLVASVEPKL